MAKEKQIIDANDFWKRLNKKTYDFFTYPDGRCGYSVSTIADALWRTESVDAVEVVRCKDCKYYMTIHCTCDGCCISDDWYCADGERKDNGK